VNNTHHPGLLEVVRQRIRVKHYSHRTEEAYVQWVWRFVLFHGRRHPRELGREAIEAFLTHLAVERHLAAATQNQALNALLFLYREVLGTEMPWLQDVQRAKKPQRLPVVLSRDEVGRVLARMEGVVWLVASLLYGSGQRLIESLRLRVQDIDLERCQVTVRSGKGAKDRVTVLPAGLVAPLREHLARLRARHAQDLERGLGAVYLPFALARKYPNAAREWQWQLVFPAAGYVRDYDTGAPVKWHLHEKTVQRAIRQAVLAGGGTFPRLGAHAPPQLRDTPARGRHPYPHDPGTPRSRAPRYDYDLHPRRGTRWAGDTQPVRQSGQYRPDSRRLKG